MLRQHYSSHSFTEYDQEVNFDPGMSQHSEQPLQRENYYVAQFFRTQY